MSSILEKIIKNKREEVSYSKRNTSISSLEKSISFERDAYSLKKSIKERSGIISEFKRKSPSITNINLGADIVKITNGYEKSNSSGISILTDEIYFGGTSEDLIKVRDQITIPILRKDFIIDEYQIIESKSLGADAILLIASCLKDLEVKKLSEFAHSLGLETILEVHSADEISSLCESIDIVGVNNRNLKLFNTDIQTSINLANKISNSFLKISESGISSSKDIFKLRKHGYDGFLIGELFMKNKQPELECEKFIKSLNE